MTPAAPVLFAAVPALLVLPFALLLALIAAAPLSPPRLKHWWDRSYPIVALGAGAIVVLYYLLEVPAGGWSVLATLKDYLGFICLIGSLFVVAGGIHIKVRGEATPVANVVFLVAGAFAANVIGTTGASMVLIRPWVRMNKIRISAHHVVFFIFIVSNVGGALTPIGDPPLFLGYLRGVPFFWLAGRVFLQWMATVAAVLAAFYVIDRRSFRRMPRKLQGDIASHAESWRFDGAVNVLLLLAIIGSVFLPARFFLREAVMMGAAVASWYLTPAVVHTENQFSFAPLREVAFLFAGIFLTMLPALDYLGAHAQALGFTEPLQYYFASGALSSVLDNAPTYANFFQLAQATVAPSSGPALAEIAAQPSPALAVLLGDHPLLVVAVSLGSVFFGAMTYIGNGPNFMVKSIAHDAGVHCPSFFGYILKYSLPILLPILALTGWLWL